MSIESELRALQNAEGKWLPTEVRDWARDNPNSDLHSLREWLWGDDAKAADEYRLGVARGLIRLHIVTDEGDRATISLVQDRRTGGGYRELGPVLRNAELRQMALRQALRELRRFEQRYKHLHELAAVFEAANGLEAAAGDGEAAA